MAYYMVRVSESILQTVFMSSGSRGQRVFKNYAGVPQAALLQNVFPPTGSGRIARLPAQSVPEKGSGSKAKPSSMVDFSAFLSRVRR
jgi:hypothetical protein